MSTPSPAVALDGGCSAVYQDILYTYQWDAFQSIPLSAGATWTQHSSNGVAVNGSRCVVGTQDGKDVLFVVGGSTGDTAYTGLQRFSFADKAWETIGSPGSVSVVQNRVMHGAAYLKSSQSIVVYSGYQDDQPVDSSPTFTISTVTPYTMQSFVSDNAPAVTNPIVQPWNDSHAYMAGGSASNRAVWTFSPTDGWRQVDVVLPRGIPDMTKVQAALVQGENESKVLQLFDMSTSPNQVTSLLVQAENGAPVPQKRAEIEMRELELLQERGLNLTELPHYNGTLAPSTIRNGFSLADTASGVVVISGGGNPDDPLCLFNQTANSWIDEKTFFDPSGTNAPVSSSVPSALPPGVATSTGTAAVAAGSSSSTSLKTILGAVLGGLFGLIALAIIALLIFRARKQRRNREHMGAFSPEAKDLPLSSNHSPGVYARGPSPNPSEHSVSGNAVAKDMISYPVRNFASEGNRLTAFPSVFANSTSVRPVQQPPRKESRGGRSDEGWSQYFEESQQTGMPPAAVASAPRFAPNTGGTAYTENSDYTNSSSNLHQSAEVPPLNVHTGHLPPSRPPRPDDSETFLESNSSDQGQESWDPVGTTESRSWAQRPASSIYTESAPLTHPGERNLLSRFPVVPNSGRPSPASHSQDGGTRTMDSREFFSGGPSMPRSAGDASGARGYRSGDDMSWLNLKAGGQ